jgi:hypothetical protein
MKRGFQIVFYLFFGSLTAQINPVQSVYFELDKHHLPQNKINQLIQTLDSVGISRCKAIYLYGY